MITALLNWFRKRVLRQHVCEEFTEWEVRQQEFEIPIVESDGVRVGRALDTWRQRACMTCGDIQVHLLRIQEKPNSR